MSVDLRRLIVRHRHVAPMLSALLSGTRAAVRISGQDGETILERDASRLADGAERFPIRLEGEPVGWVEGDGAARAVAAVLSYAVARESDKRSLAREALDRYRELNLVYDVAERLNQELDADAVASLAEEEAGRLLPGGRGMLRTDATDGILGAVATTGVAEIVTDVASDARATDAERAFGALAAAPLIAGGRLVGVLAAGTDEPREVSAAELKLLTAIALIVGPALERAREGAAATAGPR